jgi:hypothetical protein
MTRCFSNSGKKGKVRNYFYSPKDDGCVRENLQRKNEDL